MELKYEGNKKNKKNEQVLMAVPNDQVILGLCLFIMTPNHLRSLL